MQKNLLIIFAKYPEPGKVKTRYQPDLTTEQSSQLYRAMVEDLVNNLSDNSLFDLQVYFWPPERSVDMQRWLSDQNIFLQIDGDLGAKMAHAVEQSTLKGYQKSIIIGSDLPDIQPNLIEKAIHELESSDVVLGPTDDGGYYLIGMKHWHPGLFDNVAWSTELTFQQTFENIQHQQLSHHLLPVRADIDTISEVRQLAAATQSDSSLRSRIPKTSQVLASFFSDA